MKKDTLLALHQETCDLCRQVMTEKNTDYCGGESDALANFRISEAVGVPPALGILMRMTDKMQRIRSFVQNGSLAVKSESYKDACHDLLNYSILLKGLLMEDAGELVGSEHVGDSPPALGPVGIDGQSGKSRSAV